MDNDDGRRARLQQRLENAVARGDLNIDEYSDLCAAVWDTSHDEDSPELDAIAGRLERLDEARARTNPGQGHDGPGASISPHRNLPAGRHTIGVTPPADRQKGSPAIFGDHEIEGRWAPQPETTWWSVFGETKIDLTEADFPGERLVLDVQSSFSEVRVTVPRGTRVVVNATAILSEVKQRQDPDAEANGLTVVIDGVLIFGELKIRER